jgi:hypothetical protein
LSVGEDRSLQTNDYFLEDLPLRFVDGHCEGQLHRNDADGVARGIVLSSGSMSMLMRGIQTLVCVLYVCGGAYGYGQKSQRGKSSVDPTALTDTADEQYKGTQSPK